MAIIDWYSRKVLSWRISNSMEVGFCLDCLEEALRRYGKPEIFNTDQGAQFTSTAFTEVLKREGIAISMDGRGTTSLSSGSGAASSMKTSYLRGYATIGELTLGLTAYFEFYNGERPHQSLANRTPDRVCASSQGGGAMIVDRFGKETKSEITAISGQRRAAACERYAA